MSKLMNFAAAASFGLAAVFAVLCGLTGNGVLLTLAITFGTTAYHLCMRLLVGAVFNRVMHNNADYTRKLYQLHDWERKLYRLIRVKQWKGKMPIYYPDVFSPQKHSWDEIAQAMCQSELVHKTIAVLSFLPLFAAIPFGSLPVFLITSLLGAAYDMMFVIMQRYNRERVVKLVQRSKG